MIQAIKEFFIFHLSTHPMEFIIVLMVIFGILSLVFMLIVSEDAVPTYNIWR